MKLNLFCLSNWLNGKASDMYCYFFSQFNDTASSLDRVTWRDWVTG